MDIKLAVQEAVGLRPQSYLHRRIAAAAQTADRTCRNRRPDHAARRRAPARRTADRSAGAGISRVRAAAGVGDHFESLRAEVLAVQIKIDRVSPRQERAAARVANASAERHRLHTRRHRLIVVDAAQRAPVRPDISRVDAVLSGLQLVQPVFETDLPSDEQHLRHIERVGRTRQRSPRLGGVEKADCASCSGLARRSSIIASLRASSSRFRSSAFAAAAAAASEAAAAFLAPVSWLTTKPSCVSILSSE